LDVARSLLELLGSLLKFLRPLSELLLEGGRLLLQRLNLAC
jgi:hypothetical protein